MNWEFIVIMVLGVLGAALMAGGFVLYRRGASASTQALGAASMAAGAVMWAIVLFTTPVFVTRGGDSPQGQVGLDFLVGSSNGVW